MGQPPATCALSLRLDSIGGETLLDVRVRSKTYQQRFESIGGGQIMQN